MQDDYQGKISAKFKVNDSASVASYIKKRKKAKEVREVDNDEDSENRI